MRLSEYKQKSLDDSNLFWRLECGHHLNLLEEAMESITDLQAERDALESRVKYMEEVLRFYANPYVYEDRVISGRFTKCPLIFEDKGERARAALQEK